MPQIDLVTYSALISLSNISFIVCLFIIILSSVRLVEFTLSRFLLVGFLGFGSEMLVKTLFR